MSDDPFDHNGECRFCDELGMHRADCKWLLQLIAEVERLRRELAAAVDATETNWRLKCETQAEIERLREALLDLEQHMAAEQRCDFLDHQQLQAEIARLRAEIEHLHAERDPRRG